MQGLTHRGKTYVAGADIRQGARRGAALAVLDGHKIGRAGAADSKDR